MNRKLMLVAVPCALIVLHMAQGQIDRLHLRPWMMVTPPQEMTEEQLEIELSLLYERVGQILKHQGEQPMPMFGHPPGPGSIVGFFFKAGEFNYGEWVESGDKSKARALPFYAVGIMLEQTDEYVVVAMTTWTNGEGQLMYHNTLKVPQELIFGEIDTFHIAPDSFPTPEGVRVDEDG